MDALVDCPSFDKCQSSNLTVRILRSACWSDIKILVLSSFVSFEAVKLVLVDWTWFQLRFNDFCLVQSWGIYWFNNPTTCTSVWYVETHSHVNVTHVFCMQNILKWCIMTLFQPNYQKLQCDVTAYQNSHEALLFCPDFISAFLLQQGFRMSKAVKKKSGLPSPGHAVIMSGSSKEPPNGSSSSVKDYVMGYTGIVVFNTVEFGSSGSCTTTLTLLHSKWERQMYNIIIVV